MLGWVITCHDDKAQDMLHRLEQKHGPLAQCQAVSFWRGLSSNMLSRMMCHALHATDSGEGVIFLTDIAGAAPYRVASLMSHKHPRDCIVALGGPEVSSLWHQQQKNPPFVLKHDLYEY